MRADRPFSRRERRRRVATRRPLPDLCLDVAAPPAGSSGKQVGFVLSSADGAGHAEASPGRGEAPLGAAPRFVSALPRSYQAGSTLFGSSRRLFLVAQIARLRDFHVVCLVRLPSVRPASPLRCAHSPALAARATPVSSTSREHGISCAPAPSPSRPSLRRVRREAWTPPATSAANTHTSFGACYGAD